MAKYIVEIPDEIEISKDSQLVPFDMCRPSWWEEAYNKGKADAERKKGKWIPERLDAPKFSPHYCSECGSICRNIHDIFCYWCGAKMEGE